jgi:calcineurin-like phosphoesterase family protein
MRFYTSDPHYGHQNIIRYSSRPFESVEEMNQGLVDRWNAVVSDQDEVWVLGDVAMGKVEENLEYIRYLNGTKFLVPGNHDKCWSGHKKNTQGKGVYQEVGFTVLDEDIHTTLGGFSVEICHFPFTQLSGGNADAVDSQGVPYDEKFAKFRPVSQGQWLVCGHIHERWRQRGREINVGVDAWGGVPVREDVLIDLMRAGPHDYAALPWADWYGTNHNAQ